MSKRELTIAVTSVVAMVLAACASNQSGAAASLSVANAAAPTAPTPAAAPAPAPQAAAPSYASKLAAMKLDIPFTKFTLKNGLTLLVNEDHKTPTVYFNIWYHVASKNEPKGRSGFAHLFEHIMYNGSEHFNDDFFKATQKFGATNQNGSTSTDRTNYFQTVPKEALDSILWLESDRMGYLLPTLDQHRLDEQRGVVQNEKRQGENQPYGLVNNHIVAATYAEEHPYGHTVIGSMDDLNAAKVEDVKDWFRTWYGPSNAVVVLSGDITPEAAKAKVEQYFGEIPSGPPPSHPKAWVAKRTGSQREEMYDRVAAPRIYKVWNVPEFGNPEGELLDAAAAALAGDKNARLTKRLVYDEQVATSVSAFNGQSEIAGQFRITVSAKPEADLGHIEQVIEEEMGKLFLTGPTDAELEKVKVSAIADIVGQAERTSSKAQLLATWETYTGNGGGWKDSLQRTEAATAQSVAAAARKWLSDGVYTLYVKPFGDFTTGKPVDRSKVPPPGAVADATFPAFKRAKLSNGIEVMLAERHDTPVVDVSLLIETGTTSDFASQKEGTAALMGNLLDEGTATRTGLQIADELDRMGASLGTAAGGQVANVELTALTPTLDPALAIFADVIRNPAFTDADFKRLQAQQVQAVRQGLRDPNSIASRVLNRELFGAEHPFGRSATPVSVAAITKADVVNEYKKWFGSNHATIVVVGDTTLAEMTPKLEAAFKDWAPAPGKAIDVAMPKRPAKPEVYLVDRPGSVQSVILVGSVHAPRSADTEVKLLAFNSLFGGAFTSRINMNLREQHGWSYGARTAIGGGKGPRVFTLSAPVQTDATKGALGEVKKELTGVTGAKPPTAAELETAKTNAILGLGSRWETGAAVSSSLSDIALYDLPDTYYANYAAKYRAVAMSDMAPVVKDLMPDQNLVWVIVGDRAKIEKGVRDLNLGELHLVDANGDPAG
jgi:zinc protease